MNLAEFNDLLKNYNLHLETPLTESTPFSELGLDSFDMLMVLGDLEDSAGKSLDLSLNSTVGDLLEKVTAARCC